MLKGVILAAGMGSRMLPLTKSVWHCNPETWKADDYNRAIKMTASQKWKYDKKRYKIFRSCGYQVFVVWESDWMRDKDACLQFLLKGI
jgi:hypothetical protein